MEDDSDEYSGESESSFEDYEEKNKGRGRPPRKSSFVVEDSEERSRKKRRLQKAAKNKP